MLKVLLFLIFSVNILAYTNISPLNFDERIDGEGGYKEYTLFNSTKNKLTYKIYPEKKQDNFDMSQWVELYPTVVSLKPGESKIIKILITSPSGLPEGEYLTNLCIKEIETPGEQEKNIKLFTNLKIELAGYIGNLKPILEIKKIDKNNNIININLRNKGLIRGKFELYLQEDGKNPKYLTTARIFKNEEKLVKELIPKDINFKNKIKLIVLDVWGNKIIEKNIN